MVPKVLKTKFHTIIIYLFREYIYLFAMVCFKVLSKNNPFEDVFTIKDTLKKNLKNIKKTIYTFKN